jgi:hypothetical protein
MKTMQIATMPILACALLFAAPAALAFYNPQKGRWLNRDPIEERGGYNLQTIVNNNPIDAADVLGQRLLSEVKFWWAPIPTNGPAKDWRGMTWFWDFPPYVRPYQAPGCCYNLLVAGTAHIYSWAVFGVWIPGVGSAEDHERRHIKLLESAVDCYNAETIPYLELCFTYNRAKCYGEAFQGALKDWAFEMSHLMSVRLDCHEFGKRCDEVAKANADVDRLWTEYTRKLQQCAMQ